MPPALDAYRLLADADLVVEGRLYSASNATMRAQLGDDGPRCVVKPVAGERPLWDFPDGTLTGRELAAHALSEHLGWHIVPPTVWREDSPFGAAMCQWWIDEIPEDRPVAVVPRGEAGPDWVSVIDAEDAVGAPVALVHRRTPDLERLAVFDAIANNADRKGGHVLVDRDGHVWGIDHGVCFSEEPKLRTVLWGWAGEPIPNDVLADVERLDADLAAGIDAIDRWLDDEERAALRARVSALLRRRTHPRPLRGWPAIPWPVF